VPESASPHTEQTISRVLHSNDGFTMKFCSDSKQVCVVAGLDLTS